MNVVAISGNLGGDAVLRDTNKAKTAVLNFSVAVNDRRHNPKTDEWEDYTNWVRCVMFGPRAEKLADYLVKGTRVAISGKLRYNEYTDKNDQKRSSLEVIVEDLDFMSRGNNAGGKGSTVPKKKEEAPAGDSTDYDEDIPF